MFKRRTLRVSFYEHRWTDKHWPEQNYLQFNDHLIIINKSTHILRLRDCLKLSGLDQTQIIKQVRRVYITPAINNRAYSQINQIGNLGKIIYMG